MSARETREQTSPSKNPQDLGVDGTIDPRYTNEYGDNMTCFRYDAGEDSDEEVEHARNVITPFEEEKGLKFSKNGMIKFIEEIIETSSPESSDANEKKGWKKISATKNYIMHTKTMEDTT